MKCQIVKVFLLFLLRNAAAAVFHTDAASGNLEGVATYVEGGGDVNEPNIADAGRTALMYAANNGHFDVVQYLVDEGADVDVKNNLGETALMYAAREGHYDIAQYLIDNGATIDVVDMNGYSPMFFAAMFNHFDVLQLLVEKGGDYDIMDSSSRTPLFFAIANQNYEMACYLVGKGADTNVANFVVIDGKCYWNSDFVDVGSEWTEGDDLLTCKDTCIVDNIVATTSAAPSEATTTAGPSEGDSAGQGPGMEQGCKGPGCPEADIMIQIIQEVNQKPCC